MSSKFEQKYQAHIVKSQCARLHFVTNKFVRKLFDLETNDFRCYAQNVLSFAKEVGPNPELSFLYINDVTKYDWNSNVADGSCMSRILIHHEGMYCVISIQNNEYNTEPCLVVHYGPKDVADAVAQTIKEHLPNLRLEPRTIRLDQWSAFWEAVYNSTNRKKSDIEEDMRRVMNNIFRLKLACIEKTAMKNFIEESINDEDIDICIMYDVFKYMDFSLNTLKMISEYLNVAVDKLIALFNCVDDEKQKRFDSISTIPTVSSQDTVNLPLDGLDSLANVEFSTFIKEVAKTFASKIYSISEIFQWARLSYGKPDSDVSETMALVCWAFLYGTKRLPTLYELYGTYILCYAPTPRENMRKVAMLINHESRSIVIALSAAILALSGQGVHAITPKLEWAEYMIKTYDTFYRILGLSAECRQQSQSDIVYDTIFNCMSQWRSCQHSLTILDDYDILILDMSRFGQLTSDKIECSNAMRQVYDAFQQNGVVSKDDLQRAAKETDEPETFLELLQDCNKLLERLKKGEYVENEQYIVKITDSNQKSIYRINEMIQYEETVFPDGIQQFIEIFEGIERLTPLYGKVEITFRQYLEQFEQVLGVATRLNKCDLTNPLTKDDLFVDCMPREEIKPMNHQLIVSNICVNAQKARKMAAVHKRVIVLVQSSCIKKKLKKLVKADNIDVITLDEIAYSELEGNALIYIFTYDCRQFEYAVRENRQILFEQSVFVQIKREEINHLNNLWGIYLQNKNPTANILRDLWRGIDFCKYLRGSRMSNEKWWEHVKNEIIAMVKQYNVLYILCEWSVLNYERFIGEMTKKDINVMRLEDMPNNQSAQHSIIILVTPIETNMAKVPQDAHVVAIINQPCYSLPTTPGDMNLVLYNHPLQSFLPKNANFEKLFCDIGRTNSKCVQLPISPEVLDGLSQTNQNICPITCDKSFYWNTVIWLINQKFSIGFNTILMVCDTLAEVGTIQGHLTSYTSRYLKNDIRILVDSYKTIILLPKWKLFEVQSLLYEEIANKQIIVLLTFLPRNYRFSQRYREIEGLAYCILNAENIKDYITDFENPNLSQILQGKV